MVLVSFFVALILCAPATISAEPSSASIKDFAWLSGCWQHKDGETGSEEMWTRAAGQTLFGVSRTVKNGLTTQYEFVRIQKSKDGIFEYIAKPSGQAETSFKLVEISKGRFAFENRQHDFPQRVVYELKDDNSLEAQIQGTWRGTNRSILFPMKRVTCP